MDDLTLSQKLFGGSSTKNDVSAATTSGASVVYMIAVTSSSGGEVVLKPEVEDDWDSLEEGTDYIVVDEDGEYEDEEEDEGDSIEYDDGSVLDLTDGDGADIEGIEADTYTVAAYQAEAVALAEETEPDAEVDPQPDGTMDSAIDDGDAEDTDSTETADVDSLPDDSDTVTEDEAEFSEDDDEDPCLMDYGDTVEGAEVSDGYTVASTIGSVNEGDRVAVMVQDGQLTVIGVVGSGDVQQAEIVNNQEAVEEAAADAAAAQTAADNAQQSANDAQTAADVAKNTADAAQASANEAATAASNAQTAADNAAKEAQEANEKAQTAADSAAKANTDLAGVKEEVTGIKEDAVTLRSDLEGKIEAVTTTMQTDYASKDELSSTEASLKTEITNSAAGITQTVSETYAKKTDVTDAITTAKAELQTQITQNADNITLTAKSVEQAQVDIKANATSITEAKNAAATAQSTANAAKTDAQEAATAAANAQSAADAANTAASNAQTKANEAATAASTAQSAADKAKEDLATAQAKLAEVESNANATAEDLETAKAAVTAAQNAADAAQSSADTAKANAAAAQSTADTAKANAAAAQSTANTAKTNAANAQKAAEDAQASADAANDALAVLEPRVTAAETKIEQNSEAIALRATKTEVTALENRVSTAESKITPDAIVNTVKESSQFQAAGDYVTGTEAYSQLNQTVNSISGEVFNSDGSSKLEQTASSLTSKINGKQDKGDYVTGTSEYSQLKQTVSGLSSTVQSHTGSISTLEHTAEGLQVRLENQQTVSNLVIKSRRLDGWGYVVSAGVTLSKSVSTSAPEFGEVTVAQFNAATSNASAQSSYIQMTNAARVTDGEEYTFSMWARKVSGGNARPRFSLSSTNQTFVLEENLTTEWKRYSRTFTFVPSLASDKWSDITVSFGVSVLANQTGVFEICCPQLEAGDTMNPWSASYVDATDYMSFTENGLVLGDMTEDGLGNNVIIDSDSVDIRNGSEVLATFGESARVGKVDGGNVTVASDKISLAGKTENVTTPFDAVQILSKDKKYSDGTYKGFGAIKLLESDGDSGSIWKQDSGINTQVGNSATGATFTSVDDGSDSSYSPGFYVGYKNTGSGIDHWIMKAVSGDVTRFCAQNGNSIGVGVGVGGTNRGIYDDVDKHWMIFKGAEDTVIQSKVDIEASPLGGQFIVKKNGQPDLVLKRLDGKGSAQLYAASDSKGQLAFKTIDSDGTATITLRHSSSALYPATSGGLTLGTSTYKWGQIYSTKSSISTSDANDKRSIEPFDDRYDKLFDGLTPRKFMFNGEKHDRVHTGFVAQEVEKAMTDAGISDMEFAAFCKDLKTETTYEYDENGEESEAVTVTVLDDDGNEVYTYGLRYEEFAALNTWQIQRLKASVSELEETVNQLQSMVEKLAGDKEDSQLSGGGA